MHFVHCTYIDSPLKDIFNDFALGRCIKSTYLFFSDQSTLLEGQNEWNQRRGVYTDFGIFGYGVSDDC